MYITVLGPCGINKLINLCILFFVGKNYTGKTLANFAQ